MKIEISNRQACNLIRAALGLKNCVEIDIMPDEDEWFDIPSDWRYARPPPDALLFDNIMIEYRDGTTDVGNPQEFCLNWLQTGGPSNIVRFRKFNPTIEELYEN